MEVSMVLESAIVIPSDLGWMGLMGSESGVSRLTFGHATEHDVRKALSQHDSETVSIDVLLEAGRLLQRFAAGEPVDLSIVPIDLPATTEFRTRVREVVRGISPGETLTYGQVAELAGRPGAARAVGTVMSSNPVPLLIPCHRVVGSAGGLGGYSSPQGLKMKRRLLDLERRECRVTSSRNS